MKHIFILFLSFFVFPVFAVTSESYVDAAVNTLQDEIPAENTNAVLTNTGIAGEIGTKKIYDETQDFTTQTDALVTAETFNAAVQNAIDNEYVCVEWLGNTHDNAHCLLYQIHPAYHTGKNLFDINNAKVLYKSPFIQELNKTATGYTLTPSQQSSGGWTFVLIEIGNVDDFVGKTLRLSATTTCANSRMTIGYTDATGQNRANVGNIINVTKQSGNRTKLAMWLYGYAGTDNFCSEYSNIQIEEGSIATAYEPYRNLYLPSGT